MRWGLSNHSNYSTHRRLVRALILSQLTTYHPQPRSRSDVRRTQPHLTDPPSPTDRCPGFPVLAPESQHCALWRRTVMGWPLTTGAIQSRTQLSKLIPTWYQLPVEATNEKAYTETLDNRRWNWNERESKRHGYSHTGTRVTPAEALSRLRWRRFDPGVQRRVPLGVFGLRCARNRIPIPFGRVGRDPTAASVSLSQRIDFSAHLQSRPASSICRMGCRDEALLVVAADSGGVRWIDQS
ncbi:uncharacterized protein Nmag_0641 [Natrialba magadii ATCC 43099]|uniref:Uncharacterized protein n=1 Tax=Natrialba magadii (strain ATCC 43099 / DSM 3394 / CCM 3739 / CIP 104546 / IAM 13178 / JCM 8861 / NBRC 102185 / NCIMB 2190 / MS3) TaxID=547559 RepID=D3SZ92_NATMM|nr:uncharacterized protein Nmag_0641 [Natrialba magadii ATCC 43099]